MLVTVQYVGNQFSAYDEQGNEIKNRELLEQLAFEPFPALKGKFKVEVDNSLISATITPLTVNINIDTQE